MRALALIVLLGAGPAVALDLAFPAPAELLAEFEEPGASVPLALGNWRAEGVPQVVLEGASRQRSWRIAGQMTTLEMVQMVRAAIAVAGYQVLHDCVARDCGGFDFRFALPVLPEPFMHVDLGDYRYVSARKGEAGLAVMISRSASAVYLELTEVGPEGAPAAAVTAPEAAVLPLAVEPAEVATGAGIVARMQAQGAVALDDLAFASGAGGLLAGEYASLSELALWLAANPQAGVILVGHSDASGGLAPNLALSRQRAEAVRAALIAMPGVSPAQVQAEGVGALAPRASNATDEGRQQNRRVEAMPAPTR